MDYRKGTYTATASTERKRKLAARLRKVASEMAKETAQENARAQKVMDQLRMKGALG